MGPFSSARAGGALPEGWEPLVLKNIKNRTRYTLVEDGGITVLRAESNAAASGLTRKLRVNSAEYPIITWRWRVNNVLNASDLYRREGDDYPARVYVIFDYPLSRLPWDARLKLRIARILHDTEVPAATLCYVWDGKAPAGTIAPSAYTDRVRMIVVESGAARIGRWVEVERDLVADFRAAFGEEPPAIAAVALATDTDDTHESATAFFGDISLHKRAVSR